MKVGKFLKEYWSLLLVGLGLIILAIIATQKGWFAKKPKNLDPTANATDGSSVSISDSKAHNTAMNVHQTFTNHYLYYDSDLAISTMQPLYDMSDADLIAVGNKYGELYGDTEYKTLKGLLQAEYLNGPISYFTGSAADSLRDSLVSRLGKLGL